jgi:hypothetical protein
MQPTGQSMPMPDEEKVSVKELVDKGRIDLQDGKPDARPEVPETHDPMSGQNPLKQITDGDRAAEDEEREGWHFEWEEDPETFNFGRLIFQDGVEDGVRLHDDLYLRVRTLSAEERSNLAEDRRKYHLEKAEARRREEGDVSGKASKKYSVLDEPPSIGAMGILQASILLTPFALRRHIVSVNGESIPGRSWIEQMDRILSWPDVFVQMLSEITNELTNRARLLAERGQVGNS